MQLIKNGRISHSKAGRLLLCSLSPLLLLLFLHKIDDTSTVPKAKAYIMSCGKSGLLLSKVSKQDRETMVTSGMIIPYYPCTHRPGRFDGICMVMGNKRRFLVINRGPCHQAYDEHFS